MSRRLPRRTRVYDCNYDKGESYYRPALDRLDRKYSGRPEPQTLEDRPSRALTPDEFLDRTRRAFDDSDLSSARRRAAETIATSSVFDSRGALTDIRGGRPLSVSFDTDPDFVDEVNSSLRQLRINKKKLASSFDDLDATNGVLAPPSSLRQRVKFDSAADRMLESVGMGESIDNKSSMTLKKRVLKVTSTSENSDVTDAGAKWTALRAGEDEGSAAKLRARKSRALLDDIENDLSAAAERQAARERRLVGLRRLMADNERDDQEYSASMSSSKALRMKQRDEESSSTKMIAY